MVEINYTCDRFEMMRKFYGDEKADNYIKMVESLNPERIFKLGVAVDPNGWRAGYTKQTLEKRTAKRRRMNKIARQQRKLNSHQRSSGN